MLKYKNAKRAAEILAPGMARVLASHMKVSSSEFVLLVPVPLSKERRRERGYNQAELLAREMLRFIPTALVDSSFVQKKRHTPAQAKTASRSERLTNLENAFVAAAREHCELLVVVDDVTTTGSTIEAVRAALHAAGYTNVLGLTAAH